MSVVFTWYRDRSLKGQMFTFNVPLFQTHLISLSTIPVPGLVSPQISALALALLTSVSLDLHCGLPPLWLARPASHLLKSLGCPSSDDAPFTYRLLNCKGLFLFALLHDHFNFSISTSSYMEIQCSITILNWNTLVMILCSAFFFFLQIMCVHAGMCGSMCVCL